MSKARNLTSRGNLLSFCSLSILSNSVNVWPKVRKKSLEHAPKISQSFAPGEQTTLSPLSQVAEIQAYIKRFSVLPLSDMSLILGHEQRRDDEIRSK